jgi:nicotinate-nucleotide pyrophosphorylase (carboxylating)
MWSPIALTELIRRALAEDIGTGDVTTDAALQGDETGRAQAIAKAMTVVAGIEVFGAVFRTVDPSLQVTACRQDGEKVDQGALLAEISGRLASILTAERVALNLFQRMCGIATQTRQFVERVAGMRARIVDTRKTAPGLRILDKYAVRIGGGHNHRFALYDGVLIKDNHIAAAGGVGPAVQRVRARIPHTLKIEVEVRDMAELEEALAEHADVVLLDNMSLDEMAEAVRRVGGRIPLEASGNVTLERVKEVAATGVDLISVGSLTHSVIAADISLNITEAAGSAIGRMAR